MQGIAIRVMAEPGKYSVQQLQQAVQSGSLPAYIGIPLIQEKLKQQKQMQGMEQARSPEGPSIAEQVLQEAQGVEALPTNLPQQYAGGGIVAFDEGGEVERYQNTGFVQPQRRPDESFDAFRQRYILEMQEQERQERERRFAADEAARQRVMAERGGTAIPPSPYGIQRQVFTPTGITPVAATGPSAPPVRIPDEGTGILGGVVDASGAARAALTGTPRREVAATDTKRESDGIVGAPGATRFPEPPRGPSMVDVINRQLYGTETEPGLMARTEARNRKMFEELEKNKLQGKAFSDLEASLKKEAEEAGAEKGQAKNMALFKAGLAMMSGTSRYAAENIGLGALRGVEDYQAAVKDLKKAEKERQRQFAYIEQARRAEDQDNLKRRDSLLMKANEASQRMDEFGVNAIVNATGQDRDKAMKQWEVLFGGQKAIEVANIGANATMAAARERAANRGGITPALRMQAMKQVDENQIRAQVAKQLGFKKTPQPGADAGFDKKVGEAYDQAINAVISRAMGMGMPGGGGNPYQGFRIVPEE